MTVLGLAVVGTAGGAEELSCAGAGPLLQVSCHIVDAQAVGLPRLHSVRAARGVVLIPCPLCQCAVGAAVAVERFLTGLGGIEPIGIGGNAELAPAHLAQPLGKVLAVFQIHTIHWHTHVASVA